MHKPNESFNGPRVRTAKELDLWMDAYIDSTRAEAKRLAHTPSAHAAADMIDFLHIDFHIKADTQDVLQLIWKYNIRIRRMVPRFLPKAKAYTKRDSFPSYQIASMLARMPDETREIGADSLVMAYMEDFRSLYDQASISVARKKMLENPEAEIGNEEVLAMIEDSYPGQLEKLYEGIRAGTLGK